MVSCISMRMLVHLALNPVCIYPVGKSPPADSLERSSVGRAAGLYPVRRGFESFRSDFAK